MSITQKLSYARAVAGIFHGSRAFGGPVQASLRLTKKCNLRCIHCWDYSPHLEDHYIVPIPQAKIEGESSTITKEVQRLQNLSIDSERLHTLIDEFVNMGTKRFQLTGGEPFLYKHALECIAHLKHAGCYVFANTNGTLLDQHTSNELIKLGFDELRLTTMAGTSEAYVRTHPGVRENMFEKLKNGLVYLSERKNELKAHRPKVTLAFIVVTQNADNILDFAEFAHQVRADEIQYRPVYEIEGSGLGHVVPTEEQIVSIQEQLLEAKTLLESKGIPHNISYFQKVFRSKLCTQPLYNLIPCYYGWLSVNVNSDGEVYPCCKCYPSLGNIYQKTFSHIWNTKEYQTFRKKAKTLPKRKTPVNTCDCYNCVHHTANLKVYKALHPIKKNSSHIKRLSSEISKGGNTH